MRGRIQKAPAQRPRRASLHAAHVARATAAAATAVVVLDACSAGASASASLEPVTPVPVAPADFVTAVAHAVCDHIPECCAQAGYRYGASACVDAFRAMIGQSY